jgi:hypothetical protein
MMPYIQLDSTQHIILIGLVMLWACLLFGGFLFGKLNAEGTRRMPTWSRMTSSLTLVVISWLWWMFSRDTLYEPLAFAFTVGMTFGWFGDLFMAKLLPINHHVLGGISSFGLGHIAYILGLIQASNNFQLEDTLIQAVTLITWLTLAFILWYVIVYRGSEKSFLHKASLPYALLLASTTGIAMGLALLHPAFITVTIGSGLFLFSDLILATELFNGAKWKYIGDVVWLTYGPGQMLIVLGIPLYIFVFQQGLIS